MKSPYILILFTILLCSCEYIQPSTESSENDKSKKVYNGIRKNYLDGKIASTVTYKDSLKNGAAINYYPDGKVNMEFNYKDNLKHGAYKWYYENGKLYLEGNYLRGEKDGVFKMYRENGTLKSEMPWSDGNPCIGLKEYTESGKLKPSPIIKVKKINTVKLNGQCEFHFKLSDGSKTAKFYEAKLNEDKSFAPYFPGIKGKNGKAKLIEYVPRGSYVMKTLSIVASLKTRDKNFYIIEKKINVAIENR